MRIGSGNVEFVGEGGGGGSPQNCAFCSFCILFSFLHVS